MTFIARVHHSSHRSASQPARGRISFQKYFFTPNFSISIFLTEGIAFSTNSAHLKKKNIGGRRREGGQQNYSGFWCCSCSWWFGRRRSPWTAFSGVWREKGKMRGREEKIGEDDWFLSITLFMKNCLLPKNKMFLRFTLWKHCWWNRYFHSKWKGYLYISSVWEIEIFRTIG